MKYADKMVDRLDVLQYYLLLQDIASQLGCHLTPLYLHANVN